VKKGLVALLVTLALVVLVSPGIIGRLAEKSLDEQLDWAATGAEEVVVRSEGFDRGWFSSEGRHRVELRAGSLRDVLLAYSDPGTAGELPALVIDTRIDHGLIPLGSLAREKGTVVPGLGSAVSTVSLDAGAGEAARLPGTIYSRLGLGGDLHSNYLLAPGTFTHDGATADWGEVEVDVTTSPASGDLAFDASIVSFAVRSTDDNVRIDDIVFAGEMRASGFGFRVGPVRGSIDAIRFDSSAAPALGPIVIDSTSAVDDGRVSARASFRIENLPLGDLGAGTISLRLRLVAADGRALGNIKRGLEQIDPQARPGPVMPVIEADARRLFAAGLEFHIDEARVRLPDGSVDAELHLAVRETGIADFSWPGVLLASGGTLDLSIAEPLVQLGMAADPQVGGLIGMGYLRRKGDVYELHAALEGGQLTVNGAPLPLPVNTLP
jgi:uncharacterized protein YdgA (DUF945 family)